MQNINQEDVSYESLLRSPLNLDHHILLEQFLYSRS